MKTICSALPEALEQESKEKGITTTFKDLNGYPVETLNSPLKYTGRLKSPPHVLREIAPYINQMQGFTSGFPA